MTNDHGMAITGADVQKLIRLAREADMPPLRIAHTLGLTVPEVEQIEAGDFSVWDAKTTPDATVGIHRLAEGEALRRMAELMESCPDDMTVQQARDAGHITPEQIAWAMEPIEGG